MIKIFNQRPQQTAEQLLARSQDIDMAIRVCKKICKFSKGEVYRHYLTVRIILQMKKAIGL